ncbi:MAG TPA: glycosyl hydrolase, partial [Acidimicrobiia bacterium]|nr:glycosyl hydrolase [Acidimicrobiia bacterium]
MRAWRSRVRRRGGVALIGVALLAGALPVAQAEDTPPDYPVPATPADYRRPLGKLVPPEGALFGAHLQELDTVEAEQAQYEQLEADVGRPMDVNQYYYPFDDDFPTWRERYDLAKGRYPLVSWGCHDVDEILSGKWDALIDIRADAMAALAKPFFLRWCWEMDGDRPEKSKKVKSPAKFIAAWQYLWTRVYDRGATNVVRVWCPNARGFKTGAAQPFYPGDEWVDWVCTDGYNWAPEREKDWRSFVEIFDDSYAFAVSRYKPLMIGEWGAMERAPGDKAQWIREAHAAARDLLPAIAAVVVFAVDAHHDWRVTTAPDTY